MDIFVTLTFDAAHRLPCVPQGHKCGNLHGHTFTVEVHARGPVGGDTGWVMDFGDLKRLAKPVIDRLDHAYLNDIPGLENPTSECIARWLWRELKPGLPQLCRLVVRESPTSGAVYEGDAGAA
ncbi:6-carboxytetrahydropterin synthase QueD [Nitratidesulfovibrio sp. SRB-5]|uniref:6-carboxytetrahydropterin synthase QueD n=1 Tax=Nitratidesulfovibrio sp. SRB-5 TaxID=2872636 RepID=UPI0010282824|nr:6-carboxytetrahydropterin synthase QueD [Nitratidesulfovibrio sp. SRB-5]MBZ2172676.1 6-carboxytetrahydropterin synthase QueD [Nitratidesulfovibrio sp. SRB-5]RXF76373.1 6-carboxytetrahydropterin synthase QueD [Desulfovibrio sp. DS-1]